MSRAIKYLLAHARYELDVSSYPEENYRVRLTAKKAKKFIKNSVNGKNWMEENLNYRVYNSETRENWPVRWA